MTKTLLLVIACIVSTATFAQKYNIDSSLKALQTSKDSALRAMVHADSVKVDKEYTDKIKWEKLKAVSIYPVINAGDGSGVIPVDNPTEIPDASIDYKLLFEITENNPDSAASIDNYDLVEVARVINLHVASGVPLKKIFPVIVVHGPALNALKNNEYYQKKYKMDNPNIKLINELANVGAKFIACGQAMAFTDTKREALLPLVKISLTAQTALSSYRLKGYIKVH